MGAQDPTEHAQTLRLLADMYPGWHYELLLDPVPGVPRWWAHRLGPISARERAAGMRPSIGRATPLRLAEALAAWAKAARESA